MARTRSARGLRDLLSHHLNLPNMEVFQMEPENPEITPEDQLIAAKNRFRASMVDYDCLSPVKDHPWVSLVGAFTAGFGLMQTRLDLKNLTLLPMIIQLGNMILKYALNNNNINNNEK